MFYQDKMTSKTKSTAVHEDIESLTIHGLSRVASARNKYTRMVWLSLCITASISLGIVAVDSIMKYYQYNTFTYHTSMQYNELALPAITFCHTNFYNPFIFYYEDPPAPQHLPKNCSFNDRKYFANNMNKQIFDFACRMFIGTFKSYTSAMSADIPQYFQFPAGFEITPNREPCITLNRNSTLVQQAVGEKYGLHIIMYNEYFTESSNTPGKKLLTESRNGINVILHDPKQNVPIGDTIVLPPGYHTHISVTKNILKRLPHPYPSKCVKDWSNLDTIYPGKNTQLMCFSSCAYKQMYKMCSGVIPEMKVFMKAPKFPIQANPSNTSFWQCLGNSLSQLSYRACDCREHCDDETYTTTTNRNPWPQNWQTPSFLKLINKIEGKTNRNLSTSEIRNRLIKMSIYYQDFREHISEDRPLYDLQTIASELGGLMGLFMGASLLSLAEIVALVMTYMKRNMCKGHKIIELSPQSTN